MTQRPKHLSHILISASASGLILSSALLTGPLTLTLSAQPGAAVPSVQSFAGTWTGLCQDGKTFVLLNLQVVSNKIEGTVSIANASFDGSSPNRAASCTVQDPASPAHAMPISQSVVNGKTLTANTRGPQIAIEFIDKDTARLSFPSEDNADSFFEIHKTTGP